MQGLTLVGLFQQVYMLNRCIVNSVTALEEQDCT